MSSVGDPGLNVETGARENKNREQDPGPFLKEPEPLKEIYPFSIHNEVFDHY